MSASIIDVFRLDPKQQDLTRISEGFGGEDDDDDGDTTGDGCGASPPAGPTSGC